MSNPKKSVFGLCLCLLLVFSPWSFAIEMKQSVASQVEVIDGSLTLYKEESNWLGLSCQAGPLGELSDLKQIALGDHVSFDQESFVVGIIEVNEVLEDVKVLGKTFSKKGDLICIAAAERKSLPSAGDCEGMWLHIPKCQVID